MESKEKAMILGWPPNRAAQGMNPTIPTWLPTGQTWHNLRFDHKLIFPSFPMLHFALSMITPQAVACRTWSISHQSNFHIKHFILRRCKGSVFLNKWTLARPRQTDSMAMNVYLFLFGGGYGFIVLLLLLLFFRSGGFCFRFAFS